MKKEKISLTSIKILKTVFDLNNINRYPTSIAVNYILNGEINEETILLKDLVTFSSLLSLKGRKFTTYITQLVRHGYLKYFYVEGSFQKYLEITPSGKALLMNEESKRKIVYKKLRPKKELEIYIKNK
ncbi:MAG: RQC domain-containing protein [Bacilli bacterium]|jgi:hypothetical protein|nr:RQC domain-containing protein [Bacilli bacterium]NLN80387.1 hypothetical protein [Erysipelotrichia bacterium]